MWILHKCRAVNNLTQPVGVNASLWWWPHATSAFSVLPSPPNTRPAADAVEAVERLGSGDLGHGRRVLMHDAHVGRAVASGPAPVNGLGPGCAPGRTSAVMDDQGGGEDRALGLPLGARRRGRVHTPSAPTQHAGPGARTAIGPLGPGARAVGWETAA